MAGYSTGDGNWPLSDGVCSIEVTAWGDTDARQVDGRRQRLPHRNRGHAAAQEAGEQRRRRPRGKDLGKTAEFEENCGGAGIVLTPDFPIISAKHARQDSNLQPTD
jgi:hypothetical protein